MTKVKKTKCLKALLAVLMCALFIAGCSKKNAVQEVDADTVETEALEESTKEDEKTDTETEPDENDGELLSNGDFHDGMKSWDLYLTNGGDATFDVKDGQGIVTVEKSGELSYSVQAYCDGFSLKKGGVYELSFEMSSTKPLNMEARIQLNGGDYRSYVTARFNLSEEAQTLKRKFTMKEANDPAPRLCFNIGKPSGSKEMEDYRIALDNVSLRLIDGSKIEDEQKGDSAMNINLNQVGFLPKSRKTAVCRTANPGETYEIVDISNGNTVYSGKFSEAISAVASDETVCVADFSDFVTQGKYTLVKGEDKSYEFVIDEKVYDELLNKSFVFLYSQRCGVKVESEYAGMVAHPECHTGEAIIYGTETKKDVSGGWHDAGDYGRYVVPGAVTVNDLFLTYEDSRELWDGAAGDNTGIPESGNGVPDILDEARFELEWMLKMQDEKTGGVYHKVTCKQFPGFVMPQAEKEQLYLSPVSNTATGDFAAVMAKASILYKDYDSDFAKHCLKVAKDAWKYLEAIPSGAGFKNPDEIVTGEYPDGSDLDERYWASLELFKATGEEKYKAYFEESIAKGIKHGYGWELVSSYGNMAYLTLSEEDKKEELKNIVTEAIIKEADSIVSEVLKDGYMCNLGADKYEWGSNMNVCNRARMLLDAYRLSGEEKYYNGAYDQLSYLLGQNSISYSFVTGFGSLRPKNTHHRPSIATGYTVPGMVVGGPNSNLQDPYAEAALKGNPPAKCYVDNDQSYSTNEVTIYWNSPFTYLLSFIMNKK